jgi:hypothetical protein
MLCIRDINSDLLVLRKLRSTLVTLKDHVLEKDVQAFVLLWLLYEEPDESLLVYEHLKGCLDEVIDPSILHSSWSLPIGEVLEHGFASEALD